MAAATSETQPRKRRRGTSEDDGHLLDASRRLLGLGFPHASTASSSSKHEPRGPVAFSNDGLVAYRIPQTQPPRQIPSSSTSTTPAVTIAIKPLLAVWRAQPLLLSVPVLPVPTGGYSIRFLSFSSPGNSLVAIVEPNEEAVLATGSAATQGVVCIWSRRGDASALNEGWSLAAAWPLASNGLGPFGSSIIAAQWLPSAWAASPGRDLSVVATSETTQETPAMPSAQLPGMANEGKGKAKKPKIFKVERDTASGPTLLAKGTKIPDGLLLIGEDGRAHLIHRDTSIHVHTAATSSSFAVQTVSLFFPSIGSSEVEPASAPTRSVKLSQVTMHAVVDEPVLLVATTSETDRQGLVNLCELSVTNEGDEAVIVARSLESIVVPTQGSSEDGSSSSSSGGHEGTGLIAFSSSKTDPRETIHLTFASAESLSTAEHKTRTSLYSYTVERRTDISGRGSLCNAFSTLESRKRQVKDLRQQRDWGSRLQSSRAVQDHRGLLSLATAGKGKGKLQAVWQGMHEDKAKLRRSESLIDAITLEEQLIESPVVFPTQPSWSTSGALAAWVGPSSICLRAATATSAEERSQIEKVAVAIACPLLNNRTYDDVLLGNVRLLASSSNRRKLLEVLASSLDWQLPVTAGQERPLPNIVVLTKLLGVHKSICAAVETFDLRKVDASVALESLEADWTLALIRAFKILQCCRCPAAPGSTGSGPVAANWDVASLFTVMPVLSYLNEQCESLAREAFLARSGQPITPPDSPPKAEDDSEGEHPQLLPPLSVLDLLTRPLLCKIFLLVLRAAESLKQWVRSTSIDQVSLRELAAFEARQLAQEVRIASHARAASRATAQGGGAGADAEREREQQQERESQQLKADTLSAIEANRAMAVSARLEVARLGIEEMERKSAVHVDVLEKRLRSWTAPAPSSTSSNAKAGEGATQDWTWPVCSSSEGEDSQAKEELRNSLARHLLFTSTNQEDEGKGTSTGTGKNFSPSRSSSGSSASPLKNHGLPLFLTEDDFVHTLADLSSSGAEAVGGHAAGAPTSSGAAGKGKQVSRDGVTFAPLAPSAAPASAAPTSAQTQTRRDLSSLVGRRTTLVRQSRQVLAKDSGTGASAAIPAPLAAAAATGSSSAPTSADLLASTLSLQNVLGTASASAGGSGMATATGTGAGTSAVPPAPATGIATKAASSSSAHAPAPAATGATPASGSGLAPPHSLPLPHSLSLPLSLPRTVAQEEGNEEVDLVNELLARPGRVERMLLAGMGAGAGAGAEEGWWVE